jgi:hypothetical protein
MHGNWINWVNHKIIPVPRHRYVEVKLQTFSALTLGGKSNQIQALACLNIECVILVRNHHISKPCGVVLVDRIGELEKNCSVGKLSAPFAVKPQLSNLLGSLIKPYNCDKFGVSFSSRYDIRKSRHPHQIYHN